MPLAQRSSQASLRRTRSIPANISQSTKIDKDQRVRPEVAQQYALAAANRAFHLAQASKTDEAVREEAPKVPLAMPQRRIVQSTDETLANDEDPSTVHQSGRTPRDTRGALAAVSLAPGAEVRTSAGTPAERFTTPLPPTHTVSEQSSFNRLSKQKSTFSLRKSASPGKVSLPGSSGRETPTLRHSARRAPGTRLYPTGFSPGRALPTAGELLQRLPNPHQSTYDQDLAVKIARDEYLRQIELQKENRVQSATLKSDRSRIASHFRHTLRRTTKFQEDGTIITSGTDEASNTEVQSRGRRFSQGFKTTIRRIFRGSSLRGFPAQQIDATRKHYDSHSLQDENDDPDDPIRYPIIPAPDAEMVARLSLRQSNDTFIPSPSTVRHTYSQPPSIRGVRSSESLRSSSRVTSWANSATSKGTHLTNAPSSQGVDQARLSVIQEHAPHRPSSSARHHLGRPSSRVPLEEPTQSLRDIHGVDTEKMAREIRENIRKKCAAAGAEAYDSPVRKPRTHPATDHQHTSLRTSRPPLRRPGMDSDDEGSPPLQLTVRKRRGITYPSSDDDDIFEPGVPRLRWQGQSSLHHKLSLQDIANLNEGHLPSKRQSLRESRSTFFPGKGQYPDYELSPYRKALQASFEKDSSEGQSIRDVTPVDSQESASMYSRRTSGTPYVTTLFDRVENDDGHGVAYVDECPSSHYRSLVGKARDPSRTVSHRSSGSWQGWMASEVSKLEGPKEYNTDFHLPQDQPGLKGVGHVREPAGEDEADGSDRTTMRSASGSRPALDAVHFFSGFRLPKRSTSSESKETTSRRGSFNIKEDSDVSSIRSRLRVMLPGLRAPSNTSDRPSSCAPLLTHKTSEPALKLPTVPESPMTPFSKFMAKEAGEGDGSPLRGYHLRERAATSGNVHQNSERESRLRRMQSSTLAGNKRGRHGPNQYPWLQGYRDSHFYEELSETDRENKPLVYGAVPHKGQENEFRPYQGSMEDNPFPDPAAYRRRMQRSSSGEPAFI